MSVMLALTAQAVADAPHGPSGLRDRYRHAVGQSGQTGVVEAGEALQSTCKKYLPKLKAPLKLSEVLDWQAGETSSYLGLLIPGGHGILSGIPHSDDGKCELNWVVERDKPIITLGHDSVCWLAAKDQADPGADRFKGSSQKTEKIVGL